VHKDGQLAESAVSKQPFFILVDGLNALDVQSVGCPHESWNVHAFVMRHHMVLRNLLVA
jgi:hypothetical protein